MRKSIAICCASALIAALAIFVAPASARVADGIPDSWEFAHHLSLNINQVPLDQDHDALNNLSEFRSHTNPRLWDTDRDGINDGNEDADHDGVSNLREQDGNNNGDDNDNEGNNNNNNCDDDQGGGDDDNGKDDDDKGGDDDNGDECDDNDNGKDDDD